MYKESSQFLKRLSGVFRHGAPAQFVLKSEPFINNRG